MRGAPHNGFSALICRINLAARRPWIFEARDDNHGFFKQTFRREISLIHRFRGAANRKIDFALPQQSAKRSSIAFNHAKFEARITFRNACQYAAYYNQLRTHRSLNKDAPIHRAIQHVGRIISAPVLGGLDHHYCRI